MSTRLYTSSVEPNSTFFNTPFGTAPSGWLSGWNSTTSSYTRYMLPDKSSAHYAGTGQSPLAGTGASGQYRAHCRCVSPPLLRDVTLDGTVKGQVRCFQLTSAANDFTLAVGVKVIKPDGTDRGVALAVTASDDTSATPPEMAVAASTNRRFLDASENASITLSSVAALKGDRIVVEMGWRQASATTSSGVIDTGYATTGTSDLPEDDTSTSGASWVEFSANLEFASYHWDSASVPGDNGTNATTTLTITPPSGMVAGQLAYVFCQSRAAATWSIGVDGGQSWTSETAFDNCRIFWCTFNGTWGANPRFDSTSGTATTAVMHVFSSLGSSETWSVDVALANSSFTAPSSPFTVTRTGGTTIDDAAIAIAGWKTSDDNTWTNFSGGAWGLLPLTPLQYRNTSSQDQSCTFAYYIAAIAGTATGNVSKNQATLGGDAGYTFLHILKSSVPAVAGALLYGSIPATSTPNGFTGLTKAAYGSAAAAASPAAHLGLQLATDGQISTTASPQGFLGIAGLFASIAATSQFDGYVLSSSLLYGEITVAATTQGFIAGEVGTYGEAPTISELLGHPGLIHAFYGPIPGQSALNGFTGLIENVDGTVTAISAFAGFEAGIGAYGTIPALSAFDGFEAGIGAYGTIPALSAFDGFEAGIGAYGAIPAVSALAGFEAGIGAYGTIPATSTFNGFAALVGLYGSISGLSTFNGYIDFAVGGTAELYGAIAAAAAVSGFTGLSMGAYGAFSATSTLDGFAAGIGAYGAIPVVSALSGFEAGIGAYGTIPAQSSLEGFEAGIGIFGPIPGQSSFSGFEAGRIGSYGAIPATSTFNGFIGSVGLYGFVAGISGALGDIVGATLLNGNISAISALQSFVGLNIGAEGSFGNTSTVEGFAGLNIGATGQFTANGSGSGSSGGVIGGYGSFGAQATFDGYFGNPISLLPDIKYITPGNSAVWYVDPRNGIVYSVTQVDGYLYQMEPSNE